MSHTTARYDKIADFYDDLVGDDLGDSVPSTLFELIGEVRGLHALDLACGHGRVSRELARHGASVVAADISQRLLEKARVLEGVEPLGIEYIRRDVTSQQEFAAASFDLVVCHFGLTDIDDLDGTLATGSRALRPGGAFVFSIVHPCFPAGERILRAAGRRVAATTRRDGGSHRIPVFGERWARITGRSPLT